MNAFIRHLGLLRCNDDRKDFQKLDRVSRLCLVSTTGRQQDYLLPAVPNVDYKTKFTEVPGEPA